jgi:hypothetical protein
MVGPQHANDVTVGGHSLAQLRQQALPSILIVPHRPVEREGGNRDKGDQVDQARDERGLPQRVI